MKVVVLVASLCIAVVGHAHQLPDNSPPQFASVSVDDNGDFSVTTHINFTRRNPNSRVYIDGVEVKDECILRRLRSRVKTGMIETRTFKEDQLSFESALGGPVASAIVKQLGSPTTVVLRSRETELSASVRASLKPSTLIATIIEQPKEPTSLTGFEFHIHSDLAKAMRWNVFLSP